MSDWILSETNYADVKARPVVAAVLPMGATEPHNLHLPYGTDTFQVEELARRACAVASQGGARVVMLPPIPYGTETNMVEFSLAMNLNPSTLLQVIRDLVVSLDESGVLKLLILNGHGGNDFKPVVRELQGQTRVQVFLCDWFRGLSQDLQKQIFDDAGDHAGEMETALGLAFFPDFVRRDSAGQLLADDGAVKDSRFAAVKAGWVSLSRPWHLLTTNSGCGNPHAATADKGQRLMDAMVARLASFLIEFAASPLDDQFPF